ncbi:MAG: ATP-dependent DNA helicase RecG [Chromatiales bacterium]|nr:ATP-dependent DNA helicase RecG [Chromatiales bacterium]
MKHLSVRFSGGTSLSRATRPLKRKSQQPAETGHAGDAQPVGSLPRVGPALAKRLARLGLLTDFDLATHLPLRYEDRTRLWPIGSVRPGDTVSVEGVVEHAAVLQRRRRMLIVQIADGTGSLQLRFFHFSVAQQRAYEAGTRLRCYGEARPGAIGVELIHPETRRIGADSPAAVDDTLTPVYPTTEGVQQHQLRRLADSARLRVARADDPGDALLVRVAPDLEAIRFSAALAEVHTPNPESPPPADLALPWAPRDRLAFEELLAQQLSLRRLRRGAQQLSAPALGGGPRVRAFLDGLPFRPTGAQSRVIAEIATDLARTRPMLRLVQGDVGAGKTVVACAALLAAVESGHQAVLMAPTELLAGQHARTLVDWLDPLGVTAVDLTGRHKGRARAERVAQLADGRARVAIGTHALFQDAVEFENLGLVIVDEQHRFGVHQRLALRDKGRAGDQVPHQLVMTATPIPRSLAMTAYADLDLSVIDELPPGRTPVETVAVPDARRADVVERIAATCGAGRRQCYWVCALVEESETLDAEAAEATASRLAEALPELRIGLVHGRLRIDAKEQAMAAFARGETDVLVATTVIEVGVDVPNASLMVIENAERFGLAQLHQLRGRVGRGAVASHCVLLYRPPLSDTAARRLRALRESNDGFALAQIDLEMRGPGELLGTRQSGALGFRVANLGRDAGMLAAVRKAADRALVEAPELAARVEARWLAARARYGAV